MKKIILLLAIVALTAGSCNKQIDPVSSGTKASSEGTELFTPETLSADSTALAALYLATKGEQWVPNNWFTAPVHRWSGVKVAKVNGVRRVVEVRLPYFGMNGAITPAIERLTALTVLDLGNNGHLTGEFPAGIAMMKNLRILNMENTLVYGSIPASIGDLTNLDSLSLRRGYRFSADQPEYSRMSGPIPASICHLTKLRYLNLDNNNFEGELPQNIGEMVSLEYLQISANKLSGTIPASIGKLSKVKTIFANSNRFSGEIPSEISQMHSLLQLYLNDNSLTGSIPANITDLTLLEEFCIQNNSISGVIPASLDKLKFLGIVHFDNNLLEGEIPSALGSNGRMVVLDVRNNNLTGSLPSVKGNDLGEAGIWSCSILATGNRLSGKIPTILAKYPENIIPQQSGYGFAE